MIMINYIISIIIIEESYRRIESSVSDHSPPQYMSTMPAPTNRSPYRMTAKVSVARDSLTKPHIQLFNGFLFKKNVIYIQLYIYREREEAYSECFLTTGNKKTLRILRVLSTHWLLIRADAGAVVVGRVDLASSKERTVAAWRSCQPHSTLAEERHSVRERHSVWERERDAPAQAWPCSTSSHRPLRPLPGRPPHGSRQAQPHFWTRLRTALHSPASHVFIINEWTNQWRTNNYQ